jgi:hypothetical protein
MSEIHQESLLNLTILESRQLCGDLMEVFEIFKDFDGLESTNSSHSILHRQEDIH